MTTPRGDGPGETARHGTSPSRPHAPADAATDAEHSPAAPPHAGPAATAPPAAVPAVTEPAAGPTSAHPPRHVPVANLDLPPLPVGPGTRTDAKGRALVGPDGRARRRLPMPALVLGAIGVVFGDIGTSPLYALQTVFSVRHNAVAPTEQDVLGVVSLVLWCLMLIVSLTHVGLILRADNQGEGGILSLAALIRRKLSPGSKQAAVTGAEALYADMGHFGRRPIALAWFCLILPALLINYFGQGAMILTDPSTIDSPFFHLAPAAARIPLVVLATAATVIASQAVISGAFSVSRQATRASLLPRLKVVQTSKEHGGQIYVPVVNLLLFAGVLTLVLAFRSSEALASAYGLSVTGTLLLELALFRVLEKFSANRTQVLHLPPTRAVVMGAEAEL